jgi:hypothetical protein
LLARFCGCPGPDFFGGEWSAGEDGSDLNRSFSKAPLLP